MTPEKIRKLIEQTGTLKTNSYFVKELRCNIRTLLKYGLIRQECEKRKGYYRIIVDPNLDPEEFVRQTKSSHPWRKENKSWKRRFLEKQASKQV